MQLQTLDTILGWICSILVISLSIPQLLKLLKDKKTGNISFTSFWVFHIGILLWVMYGALHPSNLWTVVLADGISLFVNGLMTILLYHYKTEFSKKQKMYGYLGVIATFIIGIIFIVIYLAAKNVRIPDSGASIFSAIAPGLTTLAFTPQLWMSLKTNNWKGISIYMFLLYVINNIFWIVLWIVKIKIDLFESKPIVNLAISLTWQTISLTLFSIQFGFTLNDKLKSKKQSI
ncbi:hypothetical protein VO56_02880 [Mycoplasmopsis gallinacea]|uniref:PQ loop repeat n=1 Tax=Mycoplasmopsis gallinacea TaxID=29556 RepID=A0A0D5ZKJ6_9BACT|nr:hypothetical protein VO56_02880 [Mycoplasmopsis gallinacea]